MLPGRGGRERRGGIKGFPCCREAKGETGEGGERPLLRRRGENGQKRGNGAAATEKRGESGEKRRGKGAAATKERGERNGAGESPQKGEDRREGGKPGDQQGRGGERGDLLPREGGEESEVDGGVKGGGAG